MIWALRRSKIVEHNRGRLTKILPPGKQTTLRDFFSLDQVVDFYGFKARTTFDIHKRGGAASGDLPTFVEVIIVDEMCIKYI